MPLLYFFIQIILKILLIPTVRMFFKMEVVGRENVRSLEGPLIITPNHKSYIDHFLIGAALPFNFKLFPVRAMAHQEQMDKPIMGMGIRILGSFVAKTKGKNLDEMFDVPIEILKNKGIVLLYPEAEILKDPRIHKINSGAGELALRASADILPVAISGMDYYSESEIFRLIFSRRKIKISFGKAYAVDQYRNRKEIIPRIGDEIKFLYDPDYR